MDKRRRGLDITGSCRRFFLFAIRSKTGLFWLRCLHITSTLLANIYYKLLHVCTMRLDFVDGFDNLGERLMGIDTFFNVLSCVSKDKLHCPLGDSCIV